ncbi:MAG TPA: PstS family phosphate ABC transporter substrate-binding protein [Methanothrix sp.]|nr:PstS family phosphate ABC transporter substrate-binding protein [Methanothrix sp.]HPJ85064.1 PstS family phosphate ABC transporter substrate-binding protein [Methanothrix sp.]HPR66990.1 PstS family phosphate ABC transporter substrate-binding protein [Methanothrix sp.]
MKDGYISIVIISIVLTGAAASAVTVDGDGGDDLIRIRISGSTTVYPLVEGCARSFSEANPECWISIEKSGSGAGIADLVEGRSDVAMSSREITPEERASYETSGKTFSEHLVGYDGVCIVVSDRVYRSGVRYLSRDQIRKIYTEKITNWKDVGGPDHDIYVLSRRPGSGTRDVFDQVILGENEVEIASIRSGLSGNMDIVNAVIDADWAIGYVGYSYVQEYDLNAVMLDGTAPTAENITNRSYPLARGLYLCTFADPIPRADEFIDFVRGPDGQKIGEGMGFIPLSVDDQITYGSSEERSAE